MLKPILLGLGLVTVAARCHAAAAVDGDHGENLQAFAHVAAIAQITSQRCAGIKINVSMLRAIEARVGYDPARDTATIRDAMQSQLETIADRISALPRPQLWCESTYSQFGPDGTIAQGLMAR